MNAQIFMDTEFVSLEFQQSIDPSVLPELLSIGMVNAGGAEFYGELLPSAHTLVQCNEFVRANVLPQFGVLPTAYLSKFELACRAADFVSDAVANAKVEIVFDNDIDWRLFLALVEVADPGLCSLCSPRNVWFEVRRAGRKSSRARNDSFVRSAVRGLRRHHALADAVALRDAAFALGGLAVSS